jgi:hypothetical protein
MLGLVVVGMGIGAYCASPALRARVSRESKTLLGWTEAARQADPEGFTTYVEQRLQEDLGKLNSTRRELAMEVGSLAKKEKEERELLAHAEQFAEEFRSVYQDASDLETGNSRTFPVSVRNAEYSEQEVVRQVSMLLAEAEGYRQSLSKLEEVRGRAEQRLEELTVRISTTESQLAATAAQRGLLRARVLTDEGELLVAQVDELLDDNSVVIHGNPVRSVRELLASSQNENKGQPSLVVARSYLAANVQSGGKVADAKEPNAKIGRADTEPRVDATTSVKPVSINVTPDQACSPIFQQN